MVTVVLVALGGASGALLRWWLARLDDSWPWGTLAANAVGSLLAGVVLAQTAEAAVVAVLVLGLAGGLTTFSTLAVQAAEMPPRRAMGYLAVTGLAGVAGVLAGTTWPG